MSEAAKWALITGATGGLGREMARQLAAKGWSLVLHGRNAEALMALAGETAREGAIVRTVTADLATTDGPATLVAEVDALGIEVDLLVNNAGLGYTAQFVESDLDRQRKLVQLDVMAPLELCHAFGSRMAARGHGQVMNVASVAGVMPGPGMSTYYASKAYVL